VVLAFVFSTSTFAGDGAMWTGKTPTPAPPPVQADGAMWTGIAAPAPEADSLTEIALTLIQTLLPLL
jgi:hypothetical protein